MDESRELTDAELEQVVAGKTALTAAGVGLSAFNAVAWVAYLRRAGAK
jgi:hypothetical protein